MTKVAALVGDCCRCTAAMDNSKKGRVLHFTEPKFSRIRLQRDEDLRKIRFGGISLRFCNSLVRAWRQKVAALVRAWWRCLRRCGRAATAPPHEDGYATANSSIRQLLALASASASARRCAASKPLSAARSPRRSISLNRPAHPENSRPPRDAPSAFHRASCRACGPSC